MNLVRLSLMAVILPGCHNPPAPALVDAPLPVNQRAPNNRWTLTLPLVDGYLRYQRHLLATADRVIQRKKAEQLSVEEKATLDQQARQEAGLTVDDVLRIEVMLSKVAAHRLIARMTRLDDNPPEEGPPPLDEPMSLKKSVEDLPEERAAFGSHNIDVLLQREEELLKNWSLMMAVPELSQPKR